MRYFLMAAICFGWISQSYGAINWNTDDGVTKDSAHKVYSHFHNASDLQVFSKAIELAKGNDQLISGILSAYKFDTFVTNAEKWLAKNRGIHVSYPDGTLSFEKAEFLSGLIDQLDQTADTFKLDGSDATGSSLNLNLHYFRSTERAAAWKKSLGDVTSKALKLDQSSLSVGDRPRVFSINTGDHFYVPPENALYQANIVDKLSIKDMLARKETLAPGMKDDDRPQLRVVSTYGNASFVNYYPLTDATQAATLKAALGDGKDIDQIRVSTGLTGELSFVAERVALTIPEDAKMMIAARLDAKNIYYLDDQSWTFLKSGDAILKQNIGNSKSFYVSDPSIAFLTYLKADSKFLAAYNSKLSDAQKKALAAQTKAEEKAKAQDQKSLNKSVENILKQAQQDCD